MSTPLPVPYHSPAPTLIVWTGLAVTMVVLCLITQPSVALLGVCLLAWVGGVVSCLAYQAVRSRHG